MARHDKIQVVQIEVNGEMVDAKLCRKCSQVKPLAEFSKYKKCAGGRHSHCKKCINENSIKWQKDNPGKHCERISKWRKDNPKRSREINQGAFERRRAKKVNLPNDLTTEDWKITLELFGNCCPITGSEKVHLEHFIPISIGHGGTTKANCYPMNASLNSSKGAKNPFEWVKQPEIQERVDLVKFNDLVAYLATQNNMTVDEYIAYVYWCFDNQSMSQN